LQHAPVLVITDDASFARMVVARWQAERRLPVLTQASSDVGEAAAIDGYALAIIGPVRPGALDPLVRGLEATSAAICVCGALEELDSLGPSHTEIPCLPLRDGWLDTLMLLSSEILRRLAAESRACHAERAVAKRRLELTLGRSMREMSHVVNDALTSLLGNADLLLLAPEALSGQSREQARTIRAMALRLSEVLQHFSSLVTEIDATEKESHSETDEGVSLRIPGG
jgi:signal transduction histidine kinase